MALQPLRRCQRTHTQRQATDELRLPCALRRELIPRSAMRAAHIAVFGHLN